MNNKLFVIFFMMLLINTNSHSLDAKEDLLVMTAKTDLKTTLSMALDRYELDNGYYPSTDDGLRILLRKPDSEYSQGPYIKKEKSLIDPWGNGYRYKRFPDEDRFAYELLSWGPDGTATTKDDIVYKKPRKLEEKEVILSEDVYRKVIDRLNGLFLNLKEGIVIKKVRIKRDKYIEVTGMTENKEIFYKIVDVLMSSELIEEYDLFYETRRKRSWIDKNGNKRVFTNESSIHAVLNKKLNDVTFLEDVFKRIENEFKRGSLIQPF